MAKFAVIIPAAGSSSRMEGIDKLNIAIGAKTVLEHSVSAFIDFDQIIVVGDKRLDDAKYAGITYVEGGKARQYSVYNGLKAVRDDIDFVLIHDGARPFVTEKIISNVKKSLLAGNKAVIPCIKPKNTIRTADSTLQRDSLFEVQTPQGFDKKTLLQAYQSAIKDGIEVTDDASVTEHYGIQTTIVEGDYCNYKITTPSDIPGEIRYGNGYDLHKLVPERKLMLGLVEIPFEKGLLGHSDADVLVHAICDAILGACALGDIGRHFPDTAPAYEGLSGEKLLTDVKSIVKKEGFKVLSVDGTLIAQKPKIAPYSYEMRLAIAKVLELDISRVSIKATTEEGMGATGTGEAMAAFATATVMTKIE